MTFTFTMDAFPDYTKFDKTHKVLASLQVITEAVDTKEDKREACVLFEANAKGGATLEYDNDGSESLIKITATGGGVLGRTPGDDEMNDSEYSYETAVFGDLTEKGDFVEATIHFNALNDKKSYTVVQTNPALSLVYGDDFKNNTKKQDYMGAELSDGYDLLIANVEKAPGQITVTITDKSTGEVMQTVKITNKITFKKSCEVTIKDNDNLVTEKTVNHVDPITGDTCRVYEGDLICLVVTAPEGYKGKVTAPNGIVEQEPTDDTIWMVTARPVETLTITVTKISED